jgi:hypothetical protein
LLNIFELVLLQPTI